MNATANAVTRPLGLGRVQDFENQAVTLDELRLMADQATADGVVTPRERSLILNSLTIGLRSARQIMVPRMKVAFLDMRMSMDDNYMVTNAYLFNRLPLCDGGLDKVLGIVRTNEFLAAYYAKGDTSMLPLLAQPPVFVPESASLDRLLEVFHERKTQLVFLVDEYGGVEGLVTLRDVFRELLGEPHPTPPEPPMPPASPDADDFIIPGTTTVHDLAHRLNRPTWSADTTAVTVAGLLVAHFQQIPRPGEAATIEGVRLRVLEADRRAVRRVGIRRNGPAPATNISAE
jgi:putative hemolysin